MIEIDLYFNQNTNSKEIYLIFLNILKFFFKSEANFGWKIRGGGR